MIDGDTLLKVECYSVEMTHESINMVGNDNFSKLLKNYPNITRPFYNNKIKVTNNTTHVIQTTGPSMYARARRLNAEKLKFVKAEFAEIIKRGELRPSKSPWASPIHVTAKKGADKWRICGDYRRLNSVTKPDIWSKMLRKFYT